MNEKISLTSTSELPPPYPESRVASVDTLNTIRNVRWQEAEKQGHEAIVKSLYNADVLGSENVGMFKLINSNIEMDFPRIGWGELISFEAVGIESQSVITLLERGDERQGDKLLTHQIDSEQFVFRRLNRGVSIQFVSSREGVAENDYSNPVAIKQRIIERYKRSPAHLAIRKMVEQTEAGQYVESDQFLLEDDKLGSLDALSKFGFITMSPTIEDVRSVYDGSVSVIEQLQKSVDQNNDITFEELNGVVTFTKDDIDVIKRITVDINGNASIAVEQKTAQHYMEHANQDYSAESIPFVETLSAQEIFSFLDDAGLQFTLDIQQEMARVGEADRYGSVFTQLSREIAKMINRPDSAIFTSMFMHYDPEFTLRCFDRYEGINKNIEYEDKIGSLTPEDRQSLEEDIKERIQSIDVGRSSEPTRVFFELLKGVITTQQNAERASELPVTQKDIAIRSGACFDVFAYYLGGTKYGLHDFTWQNEQDRGEVQMLEKTYGNHTYMLKHPTKFNGIILPKGTLMQQNKEDGGWAMLRLTPFAFDDENDQLVFGSEITKALENQKEAIRIVGRTTLAGIMANTQLTPQRQHQQALETSGITSL